jgi:hypothetical protein
VYFILLIIAVNYFDFSIKDQICAEHFSQVLNMGPLGDYDVSRALLDYIEERIHPGMSRAEVMLALPDIEHRDYYPPYWDGGHIDVTECPWHTYSYSVSFNEAGELTDLSRVLSMPNLSNIWPFR